MIVSTGPPAGVCPAKEARQEIAAVVIQLS